MQLPIHKGSEQENTGGHRKSIIITGKTIQHYLGMSPMCPGECVWGYVVHMLCIYITHILCTCMHVCAHTHTHTHTQSIEVNSMGLGVGQTCMLWYQLNGLRSII